MKELNLDVMLLYEGHTHATTDFPQFPDTSIVHRSSPSMVPVELTAK